MIYWKLISKEKIVTFTDDMAGKICEADIKNLEKNGNTVINQIVMWCNLSHNVDQTKYIVFGNYSDGMPKIISRVSILTVHYWNLYQVNFIWVY